MHAVLTESEKDDVTADDNAALCSVAAVSLGRIGGKEFDFTNWVPGNPERDRLYLLLISSSSQRVATFPLSQVQQALASNDAEVRRLAALALLNANACDQQTTSLLIEAVNRDHPAVQQAAILALGERAAGLKMALRKLAEVALHSDVKLLRLKAIRAIGKSCADPDYKSQTLLDVAFEENPRIATTAITALVESLPASEACVLKFLDQADSPSKCLMLDRLATADNITDRVTWWMVTQSTSKDVDIRRLIAEVLGAIKKHNATITDCLTRLLNDQDSLVQTFALRSIITRRSYSLTQTRKFLESFDPDHPLLGNSYFFPIDDVVVRTAASLRSDTQRRALVDQVASHDAQVRRNAKCRLAEDARQDENRRSIERLLAGALATAEKYTTLHLLSLLMTFERIEPITVERVLVFLKSRDQLVARHAGQVLIKAGRSSVEPLVAIATDRSEDLEDRIRAIETLGYLGVQAEDAVPALKKLVLSGETSRSCRFAKC